MQDYLEGNTESGAHEDAIPESTGKTLTSGQNRDSGADQDVTAFEERPRTSEHYGEATARSRRDAAQASLLEDKLRKDRGQLIQIEDLRNALSTVLLHLGKGLDSLPDAIVSRCNLAPAHALSIRELVNNLRTATVNELRQLINPDAD